MPLSGNFTSQIRYWAGHAFFCATPSFILAFSGGFDSWTSVAAMLSAIATFVCMYAYASSRPYFQKLRPGLIGRAVHLGAKVRSIVAVLGLIATFAPALTNSRPIVYLLLPDMYCGMVAIQLTEELSGRAIYQMGGQNSVDTFVRTFSITFIDGTLLSTTLFAVVLACLLVLRFRSGSTGSSRVEPQSAA